MREIRGVPAVQRQAALELGKGDNWEYVKEPQRREDLEEGVTGIQRQKKSLGGKEEGGPNGRREAGLERERAWGDNVGVWEQN